MQYVSYTVYPAHYDPAPGRGFKPVQVGMTIKPTPNLTIGELNGLIKELQHIAHEMEQFHEA